MASPEENQADNLSEEKVAEQHGFDLVSDPNRGEAGYEIPVTRTERDAPYTKIHLKNPFELDGSRGVLNLGGVLVTGKDGDVLGGTVEAQWSSKPHVLGAWNLKYMPYLDTKLQFDKEAPVKTEGALGVVFKHNQEGGTNYNAAITGGTGGEERSYVGFHLGGPMNYLRFILLGVLLYSRLVRTAI